MKYIVYIGLVLLSFGMRDEVHASCAGAPGPLMLSSELSGIEGIVSMRYTPTTQAQVDKYLVSNRKLTQRLTDRAARYFPIIDRLLEEHNLPEELKYLVVVESGINPEARSRAGATGLWQFMGPTAKQYKLRIYHSVDERMDPYRSTKAALKYISYLYDRFGDWALVMAAYNAGPNRLARLMEEHGTNDYWALREHLPEETADYVPSYIAASYVFSQLDRHGFKPSLDHPDYHFTSRIEVINHKLYIDDVARLLRVDKEVLYDLNPKFKKNYIPKSDIGYGLTIPKRSWPLAQRMLDTLNQVERIVLRSLNEHESFSSTIPDSVFDAYVPVTFLVQQDTALEVFAEQLGVDPRQLASWNARGLGDVLKGEQLELPIPIIGGRFRMVEYYPTSVADGIQRPGWAWLQLLDAQAICTDSEDKLEQHRKALKAQQNYQPIYLRKGVPISWMLEAAACDAAEVVDKAIVGKDIAR